MFHGQSLHNTLLLSKEEASELPPSEVSVRNVLLVCFLSFFPMGFHSTRSFHVQAALRQLRLAAKQVVFLLP